LDRPKQIENSLSLKIVAQRLRRYLPGSTIRLIQDFLTEKRATFTNQQPNEILILENIRFYPEEKQNDKAFAPAFTLVGNIRLNPTLPSPLLLVYNKEVFEFTRLTRLPQL